MRGGSERGGGKGSEGSVGGSGGVWTSASSMAAKPKQGEGFLSLYLYVVLNGGFGRVFVCFDCVDLCNSLGGW